MGKRSHQKHIKARRVLYLLGFRDYCDGRSCDRRLFSVLSRKEQKAYLKGQKAGLRAYLKSMGVTQIILDDVHKPVQQA